MTEEQDRRGGIPAAVILAAGQGTRMRSRLPKMLHPVGGSPLVHHPTALALQLGADPVVLVVGPEAEELRRSVGVAFPDAPVRFAIQREPRGTADAVRSALPDLEGRSGMVLLLCGDVPNLRPETARRLLEAAERHDAPLTLLTFLPADPAAYGRIVRDDAGRVQRIVEAKDCTADERQIREVNSGIYACDVELLRQLLEVVRAENAQREFYLTDLVELAVGRKLEVIGLPAAEDEVAGVNDRLDLARAERSWRTRRNEDWMRAGVTMEQPETVFVGAEVTLAADVTLEPNVRLTGRTSLAAGVRIGCGCVLHDTEVEQDTVVHPYTVSDGARIGPRCKIGPFARLRPGSRFDAEVHIGNFVETKKAVLGEGTKANHLTYLGDAVIGHHVNIGCGTITCNYDGYAKYKTEIGDETLIGSDTQLVAPVKLGRRVVTGAGSVVTNDVPDGGLAVSRARQRNVEGYYDKLRRRYQRDE